MVFECLTDLGSPPLHSKEKGTLKQKKELTSTLHLQMCQGARSQWCDERFAGREAGSCFGQHLDKRSNFCSSENLQVGNPALPAGVEFLCEITETSAYTESEDGGL